MRTSTITRDPLLLGHGFSGCPGWADDWAEHWINETLDATTLANLEDCRTAGHWCAQCIVTGRADPPENGCRQCDRIIGGEQPFCSDDCARRHKAEADL